MTIKPTNWKSYFLDHENATGVHTQEDLQAIRELTIGSGNEGPEPEWYRMSREPDLLYLFLGSDRNIQLLHHVDLLGNRKTANFIPVGLCGMKTPSQVIKFDLTDFVTFHTRVPAWRNFETGIADLDQFKDLTVESIAVENARIEALVGSGSTEAEANLKRAQGFQHTNVIAIPLGLSSAIIESDIRDPAELAVHLWNQMSTLDEEHEGETEHYGSYRTNLRHLIRFLWVASKKQVPPFPYVIPEDTIADDWTDRIHSAFLQPFQVHSRQDPQDMEPQSNAALEKVAYSITSLQEHLSNHTTSIKDKSDSTGFKKKFGPHVQQMFLNASAIHPFTDPATEPMPTYEKFLAQSTLAGAKTFLRGHLRANPFLDFTPSAALTTSLFTGNLQWDDSSNPRNFSIFFCGRSSSSNSSSSYSEQSLYLKEHIGNGISESEVKQLLKQDWSRPKDASEAVDQIQHFLAIIYFVFGEGAKLATSIKTFVNHISRNKSTYDSIQRSDGTFLTQVLYCIDMAVQVHLNSCMTQDLRADVDDDSLDFRTDMSNIQRRQFLCTLPTSLRLLGESETKKREDELNADGGKIPGGKKRGLDEDADDRNRPPPEAKKIKNSNPNKAWLLKDGEKYGSVFHKNIKSCPKQGRTFICLNYWIKGECMKNCKYIHDTLAAENKPLLNDWIAKCRADFQ
jgi:hypothetical protein